MVNPIAWRIATVDAIRDETSTVRSFTLGLPEWPGHRPGQHVDLRLTAEDGYSVERSYSIASESERLGTVDITVERIPDGEVSPFLHDVVAPGDRLEVRGPIGGYFVWDGSGVAPVLLVAGGSGVVPLMSMIRQRARIGSSTPTRLLYSSRSYEEVIYRAELAEPADGLEVFQTLTRSQPPGWTGYARRIDPELLGEVAFPAGDGPRVFVCGSTRFVDTAADALVAMGYPPQSIRTERFGATG
jgi:ferredoxin-NADP reductase